MAKQAAPVYSAPSTQPQESRWQCQACGGWLAFSLPIDVLAMAGVLKAFEKGHARCIGKGKEPAHA